MINTILFIWVNAGYELCNYRKKCMVHARALHPEAKVKCISNLNFNEQLIEKIDLNDYMKSKNFDFPRYYQAKTDHLKFMYLCDNPNTLYLDTDIYLSSRIPDDKPGNYLLGSIYNKNKCNLIKEIYSKPVNGVNGVLWELRHHFKPSQFNQLEKYVSHQSIEHGWKGNIKSIKKRKSK